MSTAAERTHVVTSTLGRRRAAVLAHTPLVVAGCLYGVFIARSSFTFQGRTYYALFDDAMISMRYARNLTDGHGLVGNVGERVEGYTNFLWTCWMALVHLLPLPDRSTSLAALSNAERAIDAFPAFAPPHGCRAG